MQKKPLNTFLILVPLAFMLHNLEESLTMVSFVQENMQRLPGPIRLLEEKLQLTQSSFLIPVILLTLLLAGASIRLLFPNPPRWLTYTWPIAALTLCANAFIHIFQAVWFASYTPGLITAVLLQLPITLFATRASIKVGWISKRAAWGWFVAGFPLVGIVSVIFLFLGKALTSLF